MSSDLGRKNRNASPAQREDVASDTPRDANGAGGRLPERPSLPELIDAIAIARLESINQPGLSDIVEEIASDFIQRTPAVLSAMDNELEADDYYGLENHAHSLKSVAALVGVRELELSCKALEDRVAQLRKLMDRDPAGLYSLLSVAHQSFDRGCAALSRMLAARDRRRST